MIPGAGPFFTPGAWLAGFIKRTTTHCYKQNMKALGLEVLEEKIFLCFTHDQWRPPSQRRSIVYNVKYLPVSFSHLFQNCLIFY